MNKSYPSCIWKQPNYTVFLLLCKCIRGPAAYLFTTPVGDIIEYGFSVQYGTALLTLPKIRLTSAHASVRSCTESVILPK
jgi:hypothetical protein